MKNFNMWQKKGVECPTRNRGKKPDLAEQNYTDKKTKMYLYILSFGRF